jgi:hypothetical protein
MECLRMTVAMELTWGKALLGLALFIITSVGGLVLVSMVLVRLPEDYFRQSRPRGFWLNKHPVLRWSGLIGKNLLGALAVLLGIVLSVPAVPGPGLLTMLIGLLLLDFPGKRRLERWLIRRPHVLKPINRLRQRRGRPPLTL